MLRLKEYNKKKKRGLNEFFKMQYDSEDIGYCQVKNNIIKKGVNFNIIKEKLLGTYIMTFKNIIIIHLEEDEYKDFIYLYKNSKEYSFDIYTTINYKNVVIYHIFCINKYVDEINYSAFIECNECSYKYNCLNKMYGANLVINKRFNLIEPIDKMNIKYKFLKTIGKGTVNVNIKNLIKTLVQLINTYYLEYLPINYLNI
jgi:hydrogenase maturation factor